MNPRMSGRVLSVILVGLCVLGGARLTLDTKAVPDAARGSATLSKKAPSPTQNSWDTYHS